MRFSTGISPMKDCRFHHLFSPLWSASLESETFRVLRISIFFWKNILFDVVVFIFVLIFVLSCFVLFLHLFVALLHEAHFLKGIIKAEIISMWNDFGIIKAEIISVWNKSHFHINSRRREFIQYSSLWSNAKAHAKPVNVKLASNNTCIFWK